MQFSKLLFLPFLSALLLAAVIDGVPLASTATAASAQQTASHQALRLNQLCRQLESPSATVRAGALKELAIMGAKAAPALPQVINILGETHSFGSGGRQTLSLSPQVITAAIEVVAKIGPAAADASPYLVSFLTDRNQLFRRAQVLAALDATGVDNSATAAVMQVVNEEGRFTPTRLLAIKLLGKINPPATQAVSLLKQIAADQNDSQAHKAALDAITAISEKSKVCAENDAQESSETSALRSALNGAQSKAERLKVLDKISNLGAQAAPLVPMLIQLLSDRDKETQAEAMDAIAAIGPKAASATPALIAQLFAERDESKRDEICRDISLIDPQGKLSVPLVRPDLDDPFKMRTAIQLLDSLGTEQSITLAADARKRWKIK